MNNVCIMTTLWGVNLFSARLKRPHQNAFLDQELILYRYSSRYCSCSSCWGDRLQKPVRLRCFKSDRDKIWQECSSSK